MTTRCQDCPLRRLECFRQFSDSELTFVSQLKSGELQVEAGSTVLEQSASSTHVFTVLEGIGFRKKTLDDGRQQILNFIMPGDLVGLQAALFDEMEHSIETLTDMTLCVFQRTDMLSLFQEQPSLAFTVVWHASREERMLDEHLVSVGRRTARERIAYALVTLHDRATQLGLVNSDGAVHLPLRQHHLADALGLSLVHTNRTLRGLTKSGMISWKTSHLSLHDRDALCDIARYEGIQEAENPLI